MTATFSETPPVYSVVRTEPPVNPVAYPTQMRKFNSYLVYFNFWLKICEYCNHIPIKITSQFQYYSTYE